jgi:hypothetical protein
VSTEPGAAQAVDEGVMKFANRLREFLAFFTPENAAVLNAFGQSPYNNILFTVTYETFQRGPSIRIKQGAKICKLDVGPQFSALEFTWPKK